MVTLGTTPVRNAPMVLDMDTIASVVNDYGSLAKSCRFAVRILPSGTNSRINGIGGDNILDDLIYLCEVAEFPGRGFEAVDLRYYGPAFKMPFSTVYEDISLTFLCRSDSPEREFFDNWMDLINPVNTFNFNYRDEYACKIEIFQYSENDSFLAPGMPNPKYVFSLQDAYPILINPQSITWADDQFLRLGVTFTYTKWLRPGLDPKGRVGVNTNASYSSLPTNIVR
jgi:hypothetical protein